MNPAAAGPGEQERARWQRVKAILGQALAREPSQREHLVARLGAADDPAVIARVHQLLQADERAGDYLAEPTVALPQGRAERAELPERIGRYPVEACLGRGGSGIVYRARDPKLDRWVAIKLIDPAWTSDEDRIARIVQEARALARCNHPNIATLYGLDETEDGRRFLVLELVEGEDLSERLRRGPLPAPEAVAIARQIAGALAATHRREILHRDLKPQNVRIDPEGVIKVLDFGIAYPLSPPRGRGRGRGKGKAAPERWIAGTPGYMSPEQEGGRPLDARSDIYALGAVLGECLTGRKVASGDADASRRAHEGLDEVPEPLRTFVQRCLEPDPVRRPATMEEVRSELESIAAGMELRVLHPRSPDRKLKAPAPRTRFVGRTRELAELERLVVRTRLLTLTGPGGSGKSRLALQFAEGQLDRFLDGVHWIGIESLSHPEEVPRAVLAALEAKEEPGYTAIRRVSDLLADRQALLVLDGCEHLLESCSHLVESILSSCPAVEILATSLQRLGLTGEISFGVPSLGLPEQDEDPAIIGESEAVRLFVERARDARRSFRPAPEILPAVAEICRQLDGIPLAIELAAARVRAMSPGQIAERLRSSLAVVGSDRGISRQRTMRAAYDWGFQLLSTEEQSLLVRVSVFSGSWTLEAAESVCPDHGETPGNGLAKLDEAEMLELVTALVEKSFVFFEDFPSEGRYRLLQTARRFGAEHLHTAGASDAMRRRHAEFYLQLAERGEVQLRSRTQKVALDSFTAEHENLVAALRYFLTVCHGERALRLCLALAEFWSMRSHYGLARSLIGEALALPDPGDAVRRARVLERSGALALSQGDVASARANFEESLAISREVGDEAGICLALRSLGNLYLLQDEHDRARELFQQSRALCQRRADEEGLARTLGLLAGLGHREGNVAEAQRLDEEALAIFRRVGDRSRVAGTLNRLGHYAVHREELARARTIYRECLEVGRVLELPHAIAATLVNLANVAGSLGDDDEAIGLYQESLTIARATGHRRNLAIALAGVAQPYRRLGRLSQAREALQECFDLVLELGLKVVGSYALEITSQLAADFRRPGEAARLLGAADAIRQTTRSPRTPAEERSLELVLAGPDLSSGAPRLRDLRRSGADLTFEESAALARQVLAELVLGPQIQNR